MTVPASDAGAEYEPMGLALALETGYEQARTDIGRFNLALFGPTGVGKSTLLNTVFGQQLALTGVGRPVTVGSHLYRSERSTMGIFDTQGLEVGQHDQDILIDLRRLIEGLRQQPLSEHVHVAWYCVGAASRRFQDSEAAFVRQLSSLGLPVLVVITQTPMTDGVIDHHARQLAEHISQLRLPIWGNRAFLVNALPDDWLGTVAHGLDELLEATAAAAPTGVRAALAAAQRVSTLQKRQQAHAIVENAATHLRGKIIQDRAVDEWALMVGGISTIYGLPQAAAADTIRRSRTMLKLRNMLVAGRAGSFAFGIVPIVAAKIAAARGRRRGEPVKNPDKAVVWTNKDGHQTRYRIWTGLTAHGSTRAIGEAWLNTCEYYWKAAYPQPPTWDTEAFAQRFTDEMRHRMPRLMLARSDRSADPSIS